MSNRWRCECSFRDPSGFVFYENGSIYRQINLGYQDNYDLLMGSGLYERLVQEGLLISHTETDVSLAYSENAYKVIKPNLIPIISYPYEWSFSQLKDAAIVTLKTQKIALDYGMTLKDSSAYNIQFSNGKPVLIDTLSFEKYKEGLPWVAYKQFCEHFLATLALMSYKDVRLDQLLRVYLDGIPLDLASAILPIRTYLRFPLLMHIHLHAKSQKHFANKSLGSNRVRHQMSLTSLVGIIESLESCIKKLTWQPMGTEWADYYSDTNYTDSAFEQKKQIVSDFLDRCKPVTLWDLGANTGVFSRIAGSKGIHTVAFDCDPGAVERSYLECRKSKEPLFLPLLLDLTNPSPGIGWENKERHSIIERGPVDTVLALALVHHLAISNNLPLGKIAAFFKNLSNTLIIEFVPKSDSQVQRLLASRKDIFDGYTQKAFEFEFGKYFHIERSVRVKQTKRTVYLMRRIEN